MTAPEPLSRSDALEHLRALRAAIAANLGAAPVAPDSSARDALVRAQVRAVIHSLRNASAIASDGEVTPAVTGEGSTLRIVPDQE